MIKRCSKCKVDLPAEAFNQQKQNKDGLHIWCKSCVKVYRNGRLKEYLEAYEQNRRPQAVKRNKDRRLDHKLKLLDFFGKICSDCGLEGPPFVMEFDHRDPATKSFTVSGSNLAKSWEKLIEEASKCDVVCSNCHRLRTHKQRCFMGCDFCD